MCNDIYIYIIINVYICWDRISSGSDWYISISGLLIEWLNWYGSDSDKRIRDSLSYSTHWTGFGSDWQAYYKPQGVLSAVLSSRSKAFLILIMPYAVNGSNFNPNPIRIQRIWSDLEFQSNNLITIRICYSDNLMEQIWI